MSIRPQWWMTLQAFTFPLIKKLLRDTQRTLPGRISSLFSIPLLSGRNFHITYLPVNEGIDGTGDIPLPQAILEDLIRHSAHRAIIKRCTCRDGNKCVNHPVDLGCLLLGEGAREIDTGVSRHVDVDEALANVARCTAHGLVPFAGRFKADNYIWGVRDRGKLLTVCFCCHCCCIIRNSLRHLPDISHQSLVKLKGFTVVYDPARCTNCGTCVAGCFAGAWSWEEGTVRYDANLCKGCGWCITACPGGALSGRIDDVAKAALDVEERIGRLIDYR